MALPVEIAAMRRAIAVSAAGLGTTSPNPPVGCVLLDSAGQIIGEGYHQRKGEAHAEAQALAAAGSLAAGATAVVTLEPCNHHGRTPPCRQALIEASVGRVVIAVIDPTSRGEGGAAALRAAGIDVEVDVLADEARAVLGPWLTALTTGRPQVTWPYVISDDGVQALPGDTPDARALRLNVDAVLHSDGSVTEAVPGSHGAGILCLDPGPKDDPAEVLATLYRGGVRRLVIAGDLGVAAPFLAAGLIDHVLAHLPDEKPSGRPQALPPWLYVPPGFAITNAARLPGFVRIDARRAQGQ
jgi:diaminohydroxyphosphoribosylaminopyrimidine deaminase / 5-amino-6-(5-phosphoribosylamino)uracil reductase